MQAHELSAGSLRCLSRATRLEALCLEGISEVGDAGWASLAHLTRLTSLSVRSRGDNTGLHHVRSVAMRSISVYGAALTLLLCGAMGGSQAEPSRCSAPVAAQASTVLGTDAHCLSGAELHAGAWYDAVCCPAAGEHADAAAGFPAEGARD